jgi:NAD(P)-dependent dehydrogenase (short-subunit alcohol dehydrogenase family)
MAIACAEAGALLVISGRNKERLSETLQLLHGEGHSMCVADLTNEDELAALVDFVPKLDGFVSNAGIANPLMLQFVEKQDVEQYLISMPYR